MVIRELAAKLGLEVDWKAWAKAGSSMELLRLGLDKIVEVAGHVAGEFVDSAKEALEYGDHIEKTAVAIGVTGEALQELQHAASLSGVGAEELNGAVTRLTRTMGAAKKGGEEQAKIFSRIGVAYKNADGSLRDAGDVMEDISDHFESMPDGADKTALAMELFGKSGARMIPMLNEGAEGLASMRKEARDLGIVMDRDARKASEEINDNLERMGALTKGLWRGAIAPLLPEVSRLVKQILEWRKANGELLRQRLQQLLGGVLAAVKALSWGVTKLLEVFDLWAKYPIVAAITAITIALTALELKAAWAGAKMVLHWAKILGPIALIAGFATAILGLVDDISTYKKAVSEGGTGKNTLFGRYKSMIDEWMKPNANDPWWLKAAKDLVALFLKANGIAEGWQKRLGGGGTGAAAPAVRAVDAGMVDKHTGAAPFIAGQGAGFADADPNSWSARALRRFGVTNPAMVGRSEVNNKVELHFHGSPEENAEQTRRVLREEGVVTQSSLDEAAGAIPGSGF